MAGRHPADQIGLEPLDRVLHRQLIDLGRVDPRVDRPGHQGHAARLAGIARLRHQRDRGQHRDRRLAHRDDMCALADRLEELDDIIDVVVEVEIAGGERHVARVVPVGDVDVVLGQHRAHRVAQQRREVARHRRHQQYLRLLRLAVLGKVQQGAEGPDPGLLLAHENAAVAHDDAVDGEFGPMMLQPALGEQLTDGGDAALRLGLGQAPPRPRHRTAIRCCDPLQRREGVGVALIELVQHCALSAPNAFLPIGREGNR